MAPSLSALIDLEIARALVRRGLRPRPRRRRPPPRPAPSAAAPLSPPSFVFRPADLDPSDLVHDYVPVPGACMADMEDGEQPLGPPLPSFAHDDQEFVALHLRLARPISRAA